MLAVHREDVIVLGIFSRIPSGPLRKTWVKIEEDYPGFLQIGLTKTSLLKAEKIAVVHSPHGIYSRISQGKSVFQRKLGDLPPDLMSQVEEALKTALLIS